MLALNIYNTFYGRSGAQWKGIGQAKAVVFFLIVVVISLIQLHFTRSKEVVKLPSTFKLFSRNSTMG